VGSISIQVVGDASVGTKSKTYNYTDAQINRLVAWAKTAYSQSSRGVPDPPPLTTAQALSAWADALMRFTETSVVKTEKNAARAAVPDPTPMSST